MGDLSSYPAWLVSHGAALIVVLPIIIGSICAILPRSQDRLAWILSLVTVIACTVTSFILVVSIFSGHDIMYPMGGWDPPYGISYVVDGLNAPLLLLISFIAVLVTIYALPAVIAEVEPKKRGPFYGAYLICIASLLGMVVTGDAFNVFVFLEVSSITSYVLVAMGSSRDRRALEAAYNYLILGSIGASFFVIGLGFLYMETGTLNIADMGRILRELDGGSRVAMVAFAFIVVGLGLKLAMFPLHLWLPGAYAYAPTMVTILLASTATKAALYLLLRFTFNVYDLSFGYVMSTLTYLLAGLGIAGMIWASLQAIFQTDARRTMAYSSVAQVGYMLLGVGMATAGGLSASYLHIINHALIKGGIFVALGAFWYRFGITRVDDFRGLSKTMPWTMAAFTILGLSLIGVPFTAGFISKFNLVMAAIDRGWIWTAFVIVGASILALIYVGRILMIAYFQDPPVIDGKAVARNEAPMMMLIPLWALAIASVVLGINSDVTVDAAEGAARVLFNIVGGQ